MLNGNIVESLPLNKMPIVIAGGSFNAKGRTTNVEENGKIIPIAEGFDFDFKMLLF